MTLKFYQMIKFQRLSFIFFISCQLIQGNFH